MLCSRRPAHPPRDASRIDQGARRDPQPVPTRFNLKERVVEGDWLDQVEALDGIVAAPDHRDDRETARRSSPATARPTSASTARSIPIAGASMAASIASRGRPTPITTCRPGSISKAGCSSSPTRRKLLHAALSRPGYECGADRAGHQHRSLPADRGALAGHPLACSNCCSRRATPSPSPPSPTACFATSTSSPRRPSSGIASVAISVTSLDPAIHRTLEPRAPSARKRLAAIKRAQPRPACPAYVSIAPVMPQITDHELEAIVEAAAAAGARGGFYLPVRLPHEVAPLFRAWLDEHYPDRAAKVMATIRVASRRARQRPQFLQPDARPGAVGRPARARASTWRARVTASAAPSSRFAATCSSRPQATRCACCDAREFDRCGGDSARLRAARHQAMIRPPCAPLLAAASRSPPSPAGRSPAGRAPPACRSPVDPDVAALRDAALGDDYAWDIVEGLTTEVGQRLAGTDAEARARAWAVAQAEGAGLRQRPGRGTSPCRCGPAAPKAPRSSPPSRRSWSSPRSATAPRPAPGGSPARSSASTASTRFAARPTPRCAARSCSSTIA